jgi:hypothetical protein
LPPKNSSFYRISFKILVLWTIKALPSSLLFSLCSSEYLWFDPRQKYFSFSENVILLRTDVQYIEEARK